MTSTIDDREALMRRVGKALQTFIRNYETAQESEARAQRLHPTDFSCLALLNNTETPMSPKHIIEELNLRSSSGTALLDRLEAAGYIRRYPNPDDRRSILVALDRDRAAEPLTRFRLIEQRYRQATENLTKSDLETIANYFESIAELSSAHTVSR